MTGHGLPHDGDHGRRLNLLKLGEQGYADVPIRYRLFAGIISRWASGDTHFDLDFPIIGYYVEEGSDRRAI
jgi:hypothetical protein